MKFIAANIHSMLIDLRSKFPNLSGRQFENTLAKADIIGIIHFVGKIKPSIE
jgi:hypothetical protein